MVLPPLLVAASLGWTTTQISRFGPRVADLARLQDPEYDHDTETLHDNPANNLRYVWHAPALTADRRGLGGGVAYVLDEARLCALDVSAPFAGSSLALFSPQPRASCAQILATVESALAAWSAACPALRFVDVTNECARRHGAVEPNCSLAELTVTTVDLATGTYDVPYGSDGSPASPYSHIHFGADPLGWPATPTNAAERAVHCRGLGVTYGGSDCQRTHSFLGHVEYFAAQWLGVGIPGTHPGVEWYPSQPPYYNGPLFGESYNDTYERRRLQSSTDNDDANTQTATTRVLQRARFSRTTRRPDGGVLGWGGGDYHVETYAAIVGVGQPSTGWGWCLPETTAHCAAVDVDALGMQLIVAGSVLALVLSALLVAALLSRTAPAAAAGIGAGGVAAGVYLALTMHATLVAPCADATVLVAPRGCLDLRAAMLHEVGLALGLGSPDANATTPYYGQEQPPEWHTFHLDPGLASLADVSAATEACRNPWAHARAGVPAGVETVTLDDGRVVRPSVMLESKPSRWLTEDDVEAINVLYSQCDLGSATASNGVPRDPVLDDAEGKLAALINQLLAQAALVALVVGGVGAAVVAAVRAVPPPAEPAFAQVPRGPPTLAPVYYAPS